MKDSLYHAALKEVMEELAKDDKVTFIGQQCVSETFYGTLKSIPLDRRMEFPIAEELQLGYCIGLALEGYLPICIYQRMDFLPRACDQLVNHLDIFNTLSKGIINPKIIIRTTIGIDKAGLQHNKDLFEGFKKLLPNTDCYLVTTPEEVKEAYSNAYESERSSLIVERQDLYSEV